MYVCIYFKVNSVLKLYLKTHFFLIAAYSYTDLVMHIFLPGHKICEHIDSEPRHKVQCVWKENNYFTFISEAFITARYLFVHAVCTGTIQIAQMKGRMDKCFD